MMVCDQDVPQLRKRHACRDKLPGNAVTAIDDIRGIIDEDDLGGRNSVCARAWATTSAEQNETSLSRVLSPEGW
jgi:hypothetical protein